MASEQTIPFGVPTMEQLRDWLKTSVPTNGQVPTFNGTTGLWYAAAAAGGGVTSVNGQTGAVLLTTPNSTLALGTSGAATVTADINLAHANTWAATQTFTASPSVALGAVGVNTGLLNLLGTTSGTVGLTVAAAAGTWALTLPTTAGSAGQFLQTNGSGATTWVAPSFNPTDASDTELTTTGATVIATRTPAVQGNFLVIVYARIITATTTLSLSMTYDDGTGAQTYTWLSSVGESVGSYTFLPVPINATTAAAIVVSATAGTVDQAFISASIIPV
ncbi:MAG: hypothetical protein ACREB9_04030 [Thermoplasmata archaeon]